MAALADPTLDEPGGCRVLAHRHSPDGRAATDGSPGYGGGPSERPRPDARRVSGDRSAATTGPGSASGEPGRGRHVLPRSVETPCTTPYLSRPADSPATGLPGGDHCGGG